MGAANTKPRLARLSTLLDEWDEYAQATYDARVNNRPRGPVTGFRYLDEELGHALQPGVHVIHGDSGSGKTAWAGQVAATCGVPAFYISCEMPLLELFRRHAARVTGTFLHRFKSGELTPEYAADLARRTAEAIPYLTLADATHGPATADWIREIAPVVRGESPHLLIIVDSVHSWTESLETGANEYEALGAGMAALRAIAGELNCAILAIAERNRASAGKGGISASAGSRKAEYGSETVISLLSEDQTATGLTPITLKLDKNRHGRPGATFKLTFDGAVQTFTEGHPK